MKIITYEELYDLNKIFNNWETRNNFITQIVENQNELIEKIQELENKINFHFPEEE